MALEIERKFLVTSTAYRELAASSSRITQGYLCADVNTVRVRIRGSKGYITIKGPSDLAGLSRYEWEKEIPLNEAEDLLRLCKKDMVIDKVRYLVPFGGHTFEVDEFLGENEGLVVAEVELSSPDEPFVKPDFLGNEVTGDRRYYNSHLCGLPFKAW